MSSTSSSSAFEFNVEYVQGDERGAFVFGEVTSGQIREGTTVYLLRKDGSRHASVCRGIAGLERRLFEAGGEHGETNVGILIGLPAENVAPGDRLMADEVLPVHEIVTPEEWDFSILHGSRKLAK